MKQWLMILSLVFGVTLLSLVQGADQPKGSASGSSSAEEKEQPTGEKSDIEGSFRAPEKDMKSTETDEPAGLQDPVFNTYVDVSLAGEALQELNANKLIDVAVKLAEGEKALKRSHKVISSKQLFQTATNLAMLKHDTTALKRLIELTKERGEKESVQELETKLKLLQGTRAFDPDSLAKDDQPAQEQLRLFTNDWQRALILGDKESLLWLEKDLPNFDAVPVATRDALKKVLGTQRSAVPELSEEDSELLKKLADSSRASYYRGISFTYSKSFTASQVAVIKQAMNIIANRFLDPAISTNAKRTYRTYSMDTNYLRSCAATIRHWQDFEGFWDGIQRRALLENGFPRVNIGAYSGDNNAAWGDIGVVKTYWTTTNRTYAGGVFTLRLNTAMIGDKSKAWFRQDANCWAGLIAHEMLHNLGHLHPNGESGTFISAFQYSLWLNGRYSPGRNMAGRQLPTCSMRK